jgi:hypothetical protein
MTKKGILRGALLMAIVIGALVLMAAPAFASNNWG